MGRKGLDADVIGNRIKSILQDPRPAIRHVITPSIRYKYQPDFSDPKWGGKLYFQDGDPNNDYFKGSYVGSTSKTEKQTYTLSVHNDFQAKIRREQNNYLKSNFLSWNSSKQ